MTIEYARAMMEQCRRAEPYRLLPYGHSLLHRASGLKAVYLHPQLVTEDRALHWVRFEWVAAQCDDFDLVYSEDQLRDQFQWTP